MTDAQLGDLMIFVAIVALVVVVGGAVGMIVARRLDGIMAPPRPQPPAGPGSPEPDVEPTVQEEPQP